MHNFSAKFKCIKLMPIWSHTFALVQNSSDSAYLLHTFLHSVSEQCSVLGQYKVHYESNSKRSINRWVNQTWLMCWLILTARWLCISDWAGISTVHFIADLIQCYININQLLLDHQSDQLICNFSVLSIDLSVKWLVESIRSSI